MPDGSRFDLHVHTVASPDSRLSARAAVRRAVALGLQGLAVTDHNRVSGVAAVEEAARSVPGFLVIPGVEVSTSEGHLLAYGITRAPPPARSLQVTIEEVHAQGGLAVLAHPFRWAHGAGRRRAEGAAVDAIETLNGRNAAGLNEAALEVARRRGLALTGGSDAHDEPSLGRGVTVVRPGVGSVEELLAEIRAHRTSTLGSGQGLGGRVRLSLENAGKRTARGFRSV